MCPWAGGQDGLPLKSGDTWVRPYIININSFETHPTRGSCQLAGGRRHLAGRMGPQQALQVFHRLVVVGALAAYVADDGWHAVDDQESVTVPLHVGHSPALETAGVTIGANLHCHEC
jgi:hypothetical protein